MRVWSPVKKRFTPPPRTGGKEDDMWKRIREAMRAYWERGEVEGIEEIREEIWREKGEGVMRVKEGGDKKYGYEDWREGGWGEGEKRAYVNAILRHRGKGMRGGKDKESGEEHIAHIGVGMWIIEEMEKSGGNGGTNHKNTNKTDMIEKMGW
jgi:hypothetical protein